MTESHAGQILRQIERQNVITYKRKEPKSNHKSATDDEDGQSIPSLKASSNPPLPELGRDKRKMMLKPFGSIQSRSGGFVEKEVRQHDNILLKQRNNLLSNENMKLKTRITVLEKENERLQKTIINQTSQTKPTSSYSLNNPRDRVRPADNTLRTMIRQLRKELEEVRKENTSMKSTVKFTNLRELEAERDHLAEQTIRLRLTLEEEQSKRTNIKAMHGVATLQNRVHYLSDKNAQLTRQNNELNEKCKKLEEGLGRGHKVSDNQKSLNRSLAVARRTISQKDFEIQSLKNQIKKLSSEHNHVAQVHQNKFEVRRTSVDKRKNPVVTNKIERQSLKAPFTKQTSCSKCPKLQSQNKALQQRCQKLEAELNKASSMQSPLGQLPTGPIQPIKQEQIAELKRFLMLRFRAHRLSHAESEKYLVNCENELNQSELSKEMTLRELMQSLFVEPFCIGSNRYLQVLAAQLFFPGLTNDIKLQDSQHCSKKALIQAYSNFLPGFEIMSQEKEEEMFVQVAELITTYYQQILAALTAKRNGEGTISETHFLQFFKQIELEQEYIDFIITQIILESLDLEHLNFYAMFQIFYMPQMTAPVTQQPQKKKFEVNQENIVEEEDEEYEESKSHMGSRNKTLERREEEEGEEEYGWEETEKKEPKKEEALEVVEVKEETEEKVKVEPAKGQQQQYYQEQYQEEKMDNEAPAEAKVAEYVIDQQFDQ